MKCPACQNKLSEVVIGDLRVDACKGGCGGIWFDNFEVRQVDDPDELAGVVLEEIERDESVAVDPTARRSCPRCLDVVMMRHQFSPQHKVEVDSCPGCGGLWLDHGELTKIRQESREP